GQQCALERVGIAARSARGDEGQHVGAIGETDVEPADVGGDLLLADQRLVETRRVATSDDVTEYGYGLGAAILGGGNAISDIDTWRRSECVLYDDALLSANQRRYAHVGE